MKTLYRSFAGGEISPELYGRPELTAYQTGAATCRNFISLPHGPVANRPGTEFVNISSGGNKARLIPFVYSINQTMVLELTANTIRFHTNGGTLLSGGVPYSIATPYSEADLFDIHYVQSADVMTLVHPNYAPRELRRLGATNWQLQEIAFSISQQSIGGSFSVSNFSQNSPIPLLGPNFVEQTGTAGVAPTEYAVEAIQDYQMNNGTTVSAEQNLNPDLPITIKWGSVGGAIGYRVYRRRYGPIFLLIAEVSELSFVDDRAMQKNESPGGLAPPNAKDYYYVITLVGANGEESLPSTVKTSFHDLTYLGNSIVIQPGSTTIPYDSYRVYKNEDATAVFGFIGSAKAGAKFSDNNIEPDFTSQPPTGNNPFPGANQWPQAIAYYQQRRLFAGTNNLPQNLWGTRTGTESNFGTSVVSRADDAISFRVSALTVSAIRHIVPLGDVILLSNSGEWRLNSYDGGGLTPSTISVKPQSYVGASNVVPQVTDSSILYAAARGGHIREIVYSLSDNGAVGYGNADMSLLAPHLFNYKKIVDLAFAKAPYPILWAVSSDGTLLGMTYVPDQKVNGWHRHDTDGKFESCAVVSEGDEDFLYLSVLRTVNGLTRRYIERMHSRQFAEMKDAFFVDCGDTYSGAPATTISGLGHLEGKQVAVLGDGATFPLKTVTGGAITLEKAVSLAHIGLPITADFQTLPMSSEQVEAFGQGRNKNVNKVYLKVYRSSGLAAGPSGGKLSFAPVAFKQRTDEPYDSPPRLIESQEIEIPVSGNWAPNGQITVRQKDPLPVTIVGIALDVSVGG